VKTDRTFLPVIEQTEFFIYLLCNCKDLDINSFRSMDFNISELGQTHPNSHITRINQVSSCLDLVDPLTIVASHGNIQMLSHFALHKYMSVCSYAPQCLAVIASGVLKDPTADPLDPWETFSEYRSREQAQLEGAVIHQQGREKTASLQLRCIKYLFTFHNDPPLDLGIAYEGLILSAKSGDLDIFKWLFERASSGDLRLHEETSTLSTDIWDWGFDIVVKAVGSGKLEVVKHVHSVGFSGLEKDQRLHMESLNGDGVLEGSAPPVKRPVELAILGGDLDIVEYLLGLGYMYTYCAFQYAAMNNDVNALRLLHTHQQKSGMAAVIHEPDFTARPLFGRGQGPPKGRRALSLATAMDLAAAHGNMQALRFLDEERGEDCTLFGPFTAFMEGHLETLKYMHGRNIPRRAVDSIPGPFYESVTRLKDVLLDWATCAGHWECFQYVMDLCEKVEWQELTREGGEKEMDGTESNIDLSIDVHRRLCQYWVSHLLVKACTNVPPPLYIIRYMLQEFVTVSEGLYDDSKCDVIEGAFVLALQNPHKSSNRLLNILFKFMIPDCDDCIHRGTKCQLVYILFSNPYHHGYNVSEFRQTIANVARSGNLEKLEWINRHVLGVISHILSVDDGVHHAKLGLEDVRERFRVPHSTLLRICEKGWLDVLQKLESMDLLPTTIQSESGNDGDGVTENNNNNNNNNDAGNPAPSVDFTAMDHAASNGHLKLLQYLHHLSKQPSPLSLNEPRYPWLTLSINALDAAATNGHLDVIRFIHSNLPDTAKCTTQAIEGASKNGHLDVVKFLVETRKEVCTHQAMFCAAHMGHLDVVKYLHRTKPWKRLQDSKGVGGDGNAEGMERGVGQSRVFALWHEPTMEWLRMNLNGEGTEVEEINGESGLES
jgi:hypothetical protein